MLLKLLPLFFLTLSCKNTGEELKSSPQLAKEISNKPAISSEMDTTKNELSFDLDYIMGKFEPASNPDFTLIPATYADQSDRWIRKDVFEAFKKMYDAALKEDIHLKIISATRNFEYQKGIWEKKWSGQTKLENNVNAMDIINPNNRALKILEYSSMPGTSRHHWGTDVDLNELNNSWFEKGEGKKIYDWLNANGAQYGFVQVYTKKDAERPYGYNEEKWHWSYKPISEQILSKAKRDLKNYMITGFNGSDTAVDIDVVTKYVLGVNKACFPSE